jgi:hypothetical protein
MKNLKILKDNYNPILYNGIYYYPIQYTILLGRKRIAYPIANYIESSNKYIFLRFVTEDGKVILSDTKLINFIIKENRKTIN